jgi:hypothetical protein
MFGKADKLEISTALNFEFQRFCANRGFVIPKCGLHLINPGATFIMARINKGDVDQRFVDTVLYREADAYTEFYVSSLISGCSFLHLKDVEVVADASAAYPFSATKREVLDSPYLLPLVRSLLFTDVNHLFRATPKNCAAKDEDISVGKVRVFFPAPLVYLIEQKILFDSQNDLFKTMGSSFGFEYGVSMTSGGANRIFTVHARYKHHFSGDTATQDLMVSSMRFVYRIRQRYLPQLPFEYEEGRFITDKDVDRHIDSILNCKILLPNGQVICKKNICPSGQNNTTIDNSIIYARMLACVLCRANIKLESFGVNFYWSIFGDDWVLSTNESIDQKIFESVWTDYGMVLKKILVSDNLFEHPFLGLLPFELSFGYSYIPFDVDRLMSSAQIFATSLNHIQEFEKFLCLMRLLVNTKYFDVIRSYLIYLKTTYKIPQAIPEKRELLAQSLGLE